MTDVLETPAPEAEPTVASRMATARRRARRRRSTTTSTTTRGSPTAPEERVATGGRASPTARCVQLALTVAVVGGCMVYVLANIHADLILKTNTPTGGDFGAHVWGPAYLRDHILPHWRLSGWAPDWYAGFPMYKFYMVVPALLTVLLDVVLPYGVALKIVSALGLVALPLCCWAFARLAGAALPDPAAVLDRRHRSSCSTGRSRSTAATSPRRWRASSPSASRCASPMLYLGVLARGHAHRQGPRPGGVAVRADDPLPPHRRHLRHRRHAC